jgi:hypothetical protein
MDCNVEVELEYEKLRLTVKITMSVTSPFCTTQTSSVRHAPEARVAVTQNTKVQRR